MRSLLATLACLLVFISLSQAQPVSPELQAVLLAAPPTEKIAVIIELAEQANLRALAIPGRAPRQMSAPERREHRAGLIRALKSRADQTQGRLRDFLRGQGAENQKHLWINNSIAAEISPGTIRQLAAMPEIAIIRLDEVVTLPKVSPAATGGIEDNLLLVNVPELWALGFRGEGAVVALIDSGVDIDHPELNATWRGGSNSWFNPVANSCTGTCTSCDLSETIPCDFLDRREDPAGIAHGTGVAGIMVGGNAGGTSIGVAPQAQWIAAKIFKDDSTSLTSNIHLALQWVMDPDDDPGTDDAPDVVNNSWGLDPAGSYNEIFRVDIQNLKSAGIAVVFSAGNFGADGERSDVSPANYPESLAVGSVGTDFSDTQISVFSSLGPAHGTKAIYPDLVAPGYFIRTTDFSFGGRANSYIFLAGTSFSTPHVSGIFALLSQAFPQASLAEIEEAITLSAQDLGELFPDQSYGFGLVDAKAAFDWLSQTPHISIADSVDPANDNQVVFGPILLSVINEQTIVCKNAGGGGLNISNVQMSGNEEFSLISDNCSGQVLGAGQSCNLSVRFSSGTAGTFAGSIDVVSNDLDKPSFSIALLGIAVGTINSPPPIPSLISPADGATNIALPVEIIWRQLPDPDGDSVIDFLYVSENPHFTGTTPIPIAALPLDQGSLAAGFGGLLLVGLLVRNRKGALILQLLILTATLALLVSCGGGGGGGTDPNLRSLSLSGLLPQTTYYWKVVADDGQGGTTESSVATFTTN